MSIPPGEEQRVEVLRQVVANRKARARQLEIAHKAAVRRESCSLHLAYVLLGLKSQLGLTFDDLAGELGRAVDGSTLHKIAYRKQGIRLSTYKVLVNRINELRAKVELDPITFEEWTEYR